MTPKRKIRPKQETLDRLRDKLTPKVGLINSQSKRDLQFELLTLVNPTNERKIRAGVSYLQAGLKANGEETDPLLIVSDLKDGGYFIFGTDQEFWDYIADQESRIAFISYKVERMKKEFYRQKQITLTEQLAIEEELRRRRSEQLRLGI